MSLLDEELDELRKELNTLNEANGQPSKAPNYPKWTIAELPKAKRLVKARENAIKSMKDLIAEKKATI